VWVVRYKNWTKYFLNKDNMNILMKKLGKTNNFLTKIENPFLIIIAFFSILLTLVAVFNRYFIGATIAWYEEISILLFRLLIYWGASNAAKDNEHLRVSILEDKLRGKAKIYLALFVSFVCIVISLMGIYFGCKICLSTTMRTVCLHIPNSIIIFSTLIMGFIGLTLRYIYQFLLNLNEFELEKKRERRDLNIV
jgi:TRAP-type C4-dicarboxylate transport system permease small subunit